jgi:hypothetical protein
MEKTPFGWNVPPLSHKFSPLSIAGGWGLANVTEILLQKTLVFGTM